MKINDKKSAYIYNVSGVKGAETLMETEPVNELQLLEKGIVKPML